MRRSGSRTGVDGSEMSAPGKRGLKCQEVGEWSRKRGVYFWRSPRAVVVGLLPITSPPPLGMQRATTIYRLREGLLHICFDRPGLCQIYHRFSSLSRSSALLFFFDRTSWSFRVQPIRTRGAHWPVVSPWSVESYDLHVTNSAEWVATRGRRLTPRLSSQVVESVSFVGDL